MKKGYIYILSNKSRTVFYVGVTNDLVRRMQEHKEDQDSPFARRYRLHDLLYYEEHPLIRSAIQREKQLKRWHREWKENLIRGVNPDFRDLSGEIR